MTALLGLLVLQTLAMTALTAAIFRLANKPAGPTTYKHFNNCYFQDDEALSEKDTAP